MQEVFELDRRPIEHTYRLGKIVGMSEGYVEGLEQDMTYLFCIYTSFPAVDDDVV